MTKLQGLKLKAHNTTESPSRPESITSSLAKDGKLTVSAPREVPKTDLVGFRQAIQALVSNVFTQLSHTGLSILFNS